MQFRVFSSLSQDSGFIMAYLGRQERAVCVPILPPMFYFFFLKKLVLSVVLPEECCL